MLLRALVVAAWVSTGCILPQPLGAPAGATTLGRGGIALGVPAEGPDPDLVADNGPMPDSPPPRKLANTVSSSVGVVYGIGQRIDIEARLDTLAVFPVGASGGIRALLVDGGASGFDLGISVRGGGGGG